mmetsp:Transcript_9971/g.34759  ORF Transcript_9971/g.34759 Transcript_9971/m.34759 type:complete len:208 (-) Transcript_9971:65-688(-)
MFRALLTTTLSRPLLALSPLLFLGVGDLTRVWLKGSYRTSTLMLPTSSSSCRSSFLVNTAVNFPRPRTRSTTLDLKRSSCVCASPASCSPRGRSQWPTTARRRALSITQRCSDSLEQSCTRNWKLSSHLGVCVSSLTLEQQLRVDCIAFATSLSLRPSSCDLITNMSTMGSGRPLLPRRHLGILPLRSLTYSRPLGSGSSPKLSSTS